MSHILSKGNLMKNDEMKKALEVVNSELKKAGISRKRCF